MRAKRRERSETPRSKRRSASDAFIQYTTGCVLTATRVSIARAGRSSARQWRGGEVDALASDATRGRQLSWVPVGASDARGRFLRWELVHRLGEGAWQIPLLRPVVEERAPSPFVVRHGTRDIATSQV